MIMKMKNRSHGRDINNPSSRHIIVKISMMFRCDDAYSATFKAQFMWKDEAGSVQGCNILCESYTEVVLKISVSSEKARISLVPLAIPCISRFESLFNLIFCSVVNLKLCLRESWKNQFFSSRFCGFRNCLL